MLCSVSQLPQKENPASESVEQTNSTKYSETGAENLSSKGSDENQEKQVDPELESKIYAEIERAIEERRTCIRNECMKAKKRLDLGSSRIDDLDAITITYYLTEKHTDLELIHLGANLITDDGLINIMSGVQYHQSSLRELYLGNNQFTPAGISAIVETVPYLKNLEILSLGNIGITDDLCVSLAYSLMNLSKLKSLMINSNQIGDNGFISLSILIASNMLKAKTVQLGENPVKSRGLIALFNSLEKNTTIRDLYLNDICLQNDAVKALAKAMIKNKTIQHLNIGNCAVDDESVSLLKNGLMFNTGIKMLNLWGNRITNDGAMLLHSILEDHNHTIENITLSDNLIENEDIVKAVKELLKLNQQFASQPLDKKIAMKLMNKASLAMGRPDVQDDDSDEDTKKELEKLENEIIAAQNLIEMKRKRILEIKNHGAVQQTQ